MRIAITGASGLVGRALTEHCIARGDEVFAFNHNTLDITDGGRIEASLTDILPEAVINCAAWTDVDGCERHPQRATEVNAIGPENLARTSRKVNARFLTISTDYVFDGTKEGFYTQRDNPNPLSVYARSKLDGEQQAQLEYARTVVVRTGFVFGTGGKNFLSNVVQLVHQGHELKAIKDSWGTPTYSRHLAARLRELAELDLPGIFHVVNSGEGATYEAFAREALRLAGFTNYHLQAVTMESLQRPACRPVNSKLRCLLSEATGLAPLPSWREGLREYVEKVTLALRESTEVRA